MATCRTNNLKLRLGREGSSNYTKASYPIRYGRYSEMERGEFLFQFNLNGEVKYITGSGPDWPHPAEWLKRTLGNDWVYYSTGSYYAGVVDMFGEYYLPCPSYPTNTLFGEKPFQRQNVKTALAEFTEINPHALRIINENKRVDKDAREFWALVARNSNDYLHRRADRLHRILKAKISVLPPDCRHVDYEVIPLLITDGCLYNCSFCEIKTGIDFTCRSRQEISEQLLALKEFFGPDLQNYNSIFLGQHDALGAHPDDIIFAAEQAYAILDIKNSYMREPRLFLFGSCESFLNQDEEFWQRVNRLPFYTYVNLGLESFDAATLEFLKKPVSPAVMVKAFSRMQEINKIFGNIEVTGNFLLGDDLPAGHIPTLAAHIGETWDKAMGKGCIYISPLKGSQNTKDLLRQFREIKTKSRIQTFLYLIQRL